MESQEAAPRVEFRRVTFKNNPDWRAVIHAIQQATSKSQAELAATAQVSQTAVSELFLCVTTEPRYQLGRTLERMYERIPTAQLAKIPQIGDPEPRGMRGRRGKMAREALLIDRANVEAANAATLANEQDAASAA